MRQLTIQEQRTNLEPVSSDLQFHWEQWEQDDYESHLYWSYELFSEWGEDMMPEWTLKLGLDPRTYWHPWRECGGEFRTPVLSS